MTTLCVIQARMGSTRLPGKVLADLGGRPMLAFMLARVAPLVGRGVEEVVVATSDGAIDEPVAEVARAAGVAAVRGSEHDVLGRYLLALDDHPADTVVRLTADCPLTDPALVTEVLALHRRAGADYTSNTLIRTFPDGLDVEVMAAAALRTAAAEALDPAEREHVTPFLYRRPERFRLAALRGALPLGHERWTVDTAADLDHLRRAVDRLDDPIGAPWTEVLMAVGATPHPPDALWLRPLSGDDLAALAANGPGPGLSTADLDDPGRRRWTVELGHRAVGWVEVAVTGGVGTLAGHVPPEHQVEARRLLDQALSADLQVVDLVGQI